MKKNKLLFIILFFLQVGIGFSQRKDQYNIENLTPPTPISESLGSYGNINVGLFTGSPDISIPIYTFKHGSNNYPIKATYSSNGVRVDEISKQLGLSWNLISTGVINRTIRKEPDETSSFFDLEKFPAALSCQKNDPNLLIAIKPDYDTEKDVFTLTIPDILSVKFILDKGKIIQLEPSNIKIETFTSKDLPTCLHFKVTNIDGTEYYFGEHENSIEFVRQRSSAQIHPKQVNTAWYLTRIKTTQGEELKFNYITKGFNYISSYSQTATGKYNDKTPLDITANIPIPQYELSRVPYLNSIIDDKGNQVEFFYEIFKIPAQKSNNESCQLTKINIKSTYQLLKSFEFNYIRVPVNNSYSNNYTHLNDERIFLSAIKEISSTNSVIKQHTFEYYYPQELPARHSYAKDIYGYFNNANNFNLIYDNLPLNSRFFKNTNRNSNPKTSYYGLLKKIVYPTRGFTEIQYEPNTRNIDEYVIPPPVPQENVLTYYGSNYTGHKNDFVEFEVPFSQEGKLSITIDFDDGDPKCTYDPIHNKVGGNITLLDSKDNIVSIGNHTSEIVYKFPYYLAEGMYKLKATGLRKCTYVSGTIFYSKIKPYYQNVNKPYAGNRVSKIINYTEENKISHIKKYYYASNINNMDRSSGEFVTASPDLSPNIDSYGEGNVQLITLYSNPAVPLYSMDGYSIVYPTVIESIGGDNFEQGGIKHSFILNQEELPYSECRAFENGDVNTSRGVSMGNAFLNGKPLTELKFKKDIDTIQHLEFKKYTYKKQKSLDYKYKNYVPKQIGYDLMQTIGEVPNQLNKGYHYNVDSYFIYSQRHYLSSIESFVYTTNGNIKTTTQYNYDSPNHLQLTSEKVSTSTGELITQYQYPPDLAASHPLMQELTAQNRIAAPVSTEVRRLENGTEKQLSFSRIEYAKDATTSKLILPKFVYSKKGEASAEKKITYDRYDSHGNLLQYTPQEGLPVTIIWGYSQTYPIAKIEGATYSQIENQVENLQKLSDDANSSGLWEAFARLRAQLPDARITSYTYQPLVGVTSITAPNSLTEYYSYDSMGRLMQIKDSEGNLLKSFEYNYKSQN
ncbi:hypothetical protein O2K51_05355 [Apibacter raozihei]|uniref:hypothetical protein n=1 Tax=Apibacter raozihei TaxID=2500547 RepID=UPI000FE3EAB6|nr:hypothetical protein [Apibacter raozihei]